jgi:hypothetical protein
MLSLGAAPAAAAAAASGRTRGPVLAAWLLLALIVALQFGPLIGLLGFLATEDPVWALGGAARDALVLALLALALAARTAASGAPPLPASARWAAALVLVLLGMATAADSGLYVTALNLRRLVLVPLLFLALLLLPWVPRQTDRLLGAIVFSSALVAALGLAERLAPETLWTELLQIEAYTAANGFDKFGTLPYAASGRFFSWDLEPWTGAPWRRLVSSYLEPTTLGAAMAALLALAMARRARGHRATGLVLLALAAGLATLSKGFWLFLLMLALWRALGVPSPRQLLALAAAGCALAWATAALQLEGPLAHLGGLGSALQHLAAGAWWGEGVGSAGNYTNDAVQIGDESGLGNAIAQVGLAALLPLLWVAALARDLLATGAQRRDPGAPWLAAWLLFWMLSFLFSASSLGVGGNALGFAALALYLHPASAPQPAAG